MSAMTLALLSMVLSGALMDGYMLSMEGNITDLEMGDIQVFAEGYAKRPSLYTRIGEVDRLVTRLEQAGFRVSPRLLAVGLAAGPEASAGVALRGVDVARDARVSEVHAHVLDGRWLDPAAPRGVVLGRRLARTLGVAAGAELVVLTQGADGSMANELYTVRGVLESVGEQTDRAAVFMTQGAFRELLVVPEQVHQLIVRRPTHLGLSEAGAQARALAPGLDVKTWHELAPALADLHETQRGVLSVFFLIVYFAIGIVILNAMLMAVFERIRELGVMKALGMGGGAVLGLIMAESAVMTGLSMAVALSLSVPGLWYFVREGIDVSSLSDVSVQGIAMDPIWRASVSGATLGQAVGLFVLIATLAAAYPAARAARLAPVAAMRHQ